MLMNIRSSVVSDEVPVLPLLRRTTRLFGDFGDGVWKIGSSGTTGVEWHAMPLV